MFLGAAVGFLLCDHTFFTLQTTQGNRLSCRDQEGRRGSEEAVPGPSVFPSGDPGVSGDFWVSGKESAQGCIPKRLLGHPD